MRTINLNETIREVLEVNIGEETYRVPLGSALSYKELKEMKEMEKILTFFGNYIPNEVLETLSVAQITDLVRAWTDETSKATGKPLGH